MKEASYSGGKWFRLPKPDTTTAYEYDGGCDPVELTAAEQSDFDRQTLLRPAVPLTELLLPVTERVLLIPSAQEKAPPPETRQRRTR